MSGAIWLAAEFDTPDRFRVAVEQLSRLQVPIVEACSPYEVPGVSNLLKLRGSPLPALALAAGLGGALLGYGVQWYVDVWSYPLNVGGRPVHAVPSFVFVAFETAVLLAAVMVFVSLMTLAGLPRYYHPLWEIDGFERASLDRFWVVVNEREGGPYGPIVDALMPVRVVAIRVPR